MIQSGIEATAGFAPDELAAVRAHPGFAGAMRLAARGYLQDHQGERLLNLVAADRGRNFVAGMALHLHLGAEAGGPPLTPAALKALAQREGVCSPGRTAAVVALMQWAGYLVAETVDGRVRRLVATERLLALHRRRWANQLIAIGTIFPHAILARGKLGEPAAMRAFAQAQADAFLSGFRAARYAPEVALFSERNAGMVILFSVLLSEPADDRAPLSLKSLARGFHVSRPHVTRLFQDAEREGLFTSSDPAGGGAIIGPRLKDGLERLFAVLFLLNADCARRTLEAIAPARETRIA